VKVFISWSGSREQKVANVLKNWIPLIVQSAQPWVSSEDISAGGRWLQSITRELEECSFGIICVTQANKERPWICFEAGALSKVIESSKVVPFLIDLTPTELTGPLSQFQGVAASSKDDVFKMVMALSKSSGTNAISEEMLGRIFDKFWPELERTITAIRNTKTDKASQLIRTERDILEELLTIARNMERSLLSQANDLPTTPDIEKTNLITSLLQVLGVEVRDSALNGGSMTFEIAMPSEMETFSNQAFQVGMEGAAAALGVTIHLYGHEMEPLTFIPRARKRPS
jgi:hypothetical protein